MIRDGHLPGGNITILEASAIMGGRMMTTDYYECTWDLFKSIPSLDSRDQSVFLETLAFNQQHPSHAQARLVDCRRAKVPVTSMGFSMQDRVELLRLSRADEDKLDGDRITDWMSPDFFESESWYMWSTTFAFQPWHSAVEFRRYLHRFISQFVEIPEDVVFMGAYSARAAQMAVYQLLGIHREFPPVTAHDRSLHTQFEALIKAFDWAWGWAGSGSGRTRR
jgi:oleate hydratase